MTKTCTARSSLQGAVVHTWQFANFSAKFCFRREERQRRGTIRNISAVWTKAYLESKFTCTSCFLRNSLFSAELHVPHNYLTSVLVYRARSNFCILNTADATPKSSPSSPSPVPSSPSVKIRSGNETSLALHCPFWILNRFICIAADSIFGLKTHTQSCRAVWSENCNVFT